MDLRQKAREIRKKLPEEQVTWLEAVCDERRQGREPEIRHIMARLDGEIPRSFNPRMIPDALTSYGDRLTVLGILVADPESSVLDHIHQVASATRDYLVENPDTDEVTVGTIMERVDLSRQDVASSIGHLGRSCGFDLGNTSSESDTLGYVGFETRSAFDDFYAYEDNVEELVEEHLLENTDQAARSDTDQDKQRVKTINPIFNSYVDHVDESLCFVLMPFGEDWSQGIYDLLEEILGGEGYDALRADEAHGSFIMEDIWAKINQAGLIIADVTGKNPNVMYELGIAHTVGKPVILITQDVEEIPFDFRHLRHYDYGGTAGTETLREKLPGAIEEVKEEQQEGEELNMAIPHSPTYFPGHVGNSGPVGRRRALGQGGIPLD